MCVCPRSKVLVGLTCWWQTIWLTPPFRTTQRAPNKLPSGNHPSKKKLFLDELPPLKSWTWGTFHCQNVATSMPMPMLVGPHLCCQTKKGVDGPTGFYSWHDLGIPIEAPSKSHSNPPQNPIRTSKSRYSITSSKNPVKIPNIWG